MSLVYKNRPPMDPSAVVRRHLGIDGLQDLLRDKRLRFTRVDQFHDSDEYEGSVPRQQIDDQLPIFSGYHLMQSSFAQVASHFPGMELPRQPYRDPWEMMTIRRRAFTRSVHASCWTAGPESGAIWRLYCEDGGVRGHGVAIRTTLEKLESSVESLNLYVSPVIYRHYREGAAFTDLLDAVMHKRMAFQEEQEVRLLCCDVAHFGALDYALTGDHSYGPKPEVPAELSEHVWMPWDVLTVADAITISSFATDEYEARVRALIGAEASEANRLVEQSPLGERGFKAAF